MMNIPMNNPAVQRFVNFANDIQKIGKHPKQVAQELLNSGQMTQQQYNQLRQKVNKIMGTNY